MRPTTQDRLQWLTPRRAGQISLLVVAGAALTIAALSLLYSGPPGASRASSLTSAPDGEVHVAGTVGVNYVEGAPGEAATSHITLHGAEGIDIRVAGSGAAGYGPGTFVEVRGEKLGSSVEASSFTAATDAASQAAPWLALGAVVLIGFFSATIAAAVQSLTARGQKRAPRQPSAASVRPSPDDED